MIDFHTHPVMIKELIEKDAALGTHIRTVFGLYFPPQPLDIFLAELDEAGVDQAVLLPIDCTTAHNCQIVANETIAELVEKQPRFIGFASVDPGRKEAPRLVEQAVTQLGLKGLKLDPALQQFYPNDRNIAYPVYQTCSELNIPVMIHCGMSWAMAGLEKYAYPLPIEEIAIDFPSLRIIIPHVGWPWFTEAVMLALKHQNIYLDTSIIYSGTPKDALRHVLAEQIGLPVLERSLHYQVLFGSNYPRADIRRSVRGLRALEMSASLRDHVCHTNASTLLGLGDSSL
ncbi:amidohydrolase family protein [candidate division KSB3 bacterium]|uniref:Amidohydrolase family protein n=1 Tax=candidate division KSB3 bacterium TaxID=2044937 RepID=A0A9D5JZW0_9BACT|nr:amidohydrolase family protein [candidate division KSB3 bacterium]MBD3327168.1 amidohydrolase family protein [candidate division KSB3 bacterium]